MIRISTRSAVVGAVLLIMLAFSAVPGSATRPLRHDDGTPATPSCLPATPHAAPTADGTPVSGNAADYPFDLVFIDALVFHQETAVAMAEIARTSSERFEVIDLADAVITVQASDLVQLRAWRSAWYPDADPVPANVIAGLVDQGSMMVGGMSGSAEISITQDTGVALQRLCTPDGPFDRAFLSELIPLHQRAIGMARLALDRAEHAELRALADSVVTTHERELAQMTSWLAQWYPAEAVTGVEDVPAEETPPA